MCESRNKPNLLRKLLHGFKVPRSIGFVHRNNVGCHSPVKMSEHLKEDLSTCVYLVRADDPVYLQSLGSCRVRAVFFYSKVSSTGGRPCQYDRIDIPRPWGDTCAMKAQSKTAQLQIRVSRSEKAIVERAAKRENMDMSSYVLSRLISIPAMRFQECVTAVAGPKSTYGLAELNSLLTNLSSVELKPAVGSAPFVALPPVMANYVAAMVELACGRRHVPIPPWTRAIVPLTDPWFASASRSLRQYLLMASPAPFRRRNIFIDSSLGSRV